VSTTGDDVIMVNGNHFFKVSDTDSLTTMMVCVVSVDGQLAKIDRSRVVFVSCPSVRPCCRPRSG